jgi:hypothetical protein
MVELTPQQRQALEQHGGPVRVIDPATNDAYVLLRAEVYERLAGTAPPPEEAPAAIPPGVLRSMQAFWRDLPELLKSSRNRGQWVVYHGEERVGVAADDVTLIRELLRRGVPDDAYYLATVRPRDLPPWEPEEVEPLGPQHLEDD